MARPRSPDKLNQEKVTIYIYKTLLRELRLAHAEYCIGNDEQKMTYTKFINNVIERGLSDFIISRRGDDGRDIP